MNEWRVLLVAVTAWSHLALGQTSPLPEDLSLDASREWQREFEWSYRQLLTDGKRWPQPGAHGFLEVMASEYWNGNLWRIRRSDWGIYERIDGLWFPKLWWLEKPKSQIELELER